MLKKASEIQGQTTLPGCIVALDGALYQISDAQKLEDGDRLLTLKPYDPEAPVNAIRENCQFPKCSERSTYIFRHVGFCPDHWRYINKERPDRGSPLIPYLLKTLSDPEVQRRLQVPRRIR